MGKKRIEIELPVPLPTWNRMLAMGRWELKRLRHLIHLFVSLSYQYGDDWPTQTDFQGKRQSTELLLLDYYQTIRPSRSNRLAFRKLRDELKARGS